MTQIEAVKIAQAAKKRYDTALINAVDQKTDFYVLEAKKAYETAVKNIPL
jgi:hypothetical protein